jgi:hypothetical protein
LKKSLRDGALIAEIVGAVAVVISLIYVGVSVNQNTRALMVSNHQALVAMDQDKNGWLRDAQFAEIYEIAEADVDRLSPAQLLQYRTFEADTFNAWEFAFITHNDGMMDENIWAGWDGYYRSRMQAKGPQWFWRTSKDTFSPAFRIYVDSVLKDNR